MSQIGCQGGGALYQILPFHQVYCVVWPEDQEQGSVASGICGTSIGKEYRYSATVRSERKQPGSPAQWRLNNRTPYDRDPGPNGSGNRFDEQSLTAGRAYGFRRNECGSPACCEQAGNGGAYWIK
jgi:hypothetical protein